MVAFYLMMINDKSTSFGLGDVPPKWKREVDEAYKVQHPEQIQE